MCVWLNHTCFCKLVFLDDLQPVISINHRQNTFLTQEFRCQAKRSAKNLGNGHLAPQPTLLQIEQDGRNGDQWSAITISKQFPLKRSPSFAFFSLFSFPDKLLIALLAIARDCFQVYLWRSFSLITFLFTGGRFSYAAPRPRRGHDNKRATGPLVMVGHIHCYN